MKLDSLHTLLVAGVNTRAIVKSGKELGLRIVSVERFDDVDLEKYADILYTVEIEDGGKGITQFEQEKFFNLTSKALESHDIDATILASGMEHDTDRIKDLEKRTKLVGNKASRIELCEDKVKLFDLADELGIPHPQTERVRTLEEALEAASQIGYPTLLKPSTSGGGIGIEVVETPDEIKEMYKKVLSKGDGDSIYVQQYIQGTDASASVISNGEEAKCLTVNEQIIGDERLDVPRRFGYCGNIIPLEAREKNISKISKYSEIICSEMNLVGSNGVDFVINDEPYLVELNPRFQNTLDLVEGSLGINLVKAHFESVNGEIIDKKDLKRFSAKLVIYAKKDIKFPSLSDTESIVDVPREGSKVRRGEPVCSVIKFGKKREYVKKKAYEKAREIQQKVYSSSKSSGLREPE